MTFAGTALHLLRERNVLEIVFYDLSRRRERGGTLSAANVMDIIHSASSGAVGRRNVGRTVSNVGGHC